jgi:hypothetical protein
MGDRTERRRTSFERDVRELFMKVVVGLVLGFILKIFMGTDAWLVPMLVGVFAVYLLHSFIRDDGKNAD